MPFPQGGDFTRSVNRTFKVVSSDRRVCKHDNGTTVCDEGHKLQFPGTCFSQPVGTFNSTSEDFQPSFPVCTSDYSSLGFSNGFVFSSGDKVGLGVVYQRLTGEERSLLLYQAQKELERSFEIYKLGDPVISSSFISGVSNQIIGSIFAQAVPSVVSSFWKMPKFNPGILPHLPGTYSDLYAYDVYSYFSVYNRLTFFLIETIAATFRTTGDVSFVSSLVSTDYYSTITDSVGTCVGDETPPDIVIHSQTASGIELAPRDHIVDFSLADSVGGVDLSSVFVSLNSTGHGDIALLSAGSDQTGGNVSVVGDSSSYRVTYTPPFLWDYNEIVTVTVSGADLPPEVDGDPFYCGSAGVNIVVGDITFQVLNETDFPATISGAGDESPPYILSRFPEEDSTDNDVFTTVSLVIADELTGVDLSTLFVNIDNVSLIESGITKTSQVSLTGTPAAYTITYSPTQAFDYNSLIDVVVSASDRSELGPNQFSDTYSFSFITDSSLQIENFSPSVGTTITTSGLSISADIYDLDYGIDPDQTFFKINSSVVSGVLTTISGGFGYNMSYEPPSFDYGGPINVTVHATNNNSGAPVVKEEFYTLFYGYRITQFNESPYQHERRVDVFVRARNVELLQRDLATGYFFTTYTQPKEDIGAQIEAINPILDLGATLSVVAPEHRYGELVTVEFYIKDLDGHELGPYTFSYTIENRPN